MAVDDATLRAVGFSRSKILAIRDIAAKAAEGIVPTREEAEALSDAELISRLVPLRGVGQWTVEMLLIFSLGRLDVFPLDDFGVRKGLKIAFGLEEMPSKRDMLALTDAWRPYRSIGTWYLWRLVSNQAPSRRVRKARPDARRPPTRKASSNGARSRAALCPDPGAQPPPIARASAGISPRVAGAPVEGFLLVLSAWA